MKVDQVPCVGAYSMRPCGVRYVFLPAGMTVLSQSWVSSALRPPMRPAGPPNLTRDSQLMIIVTAELIKTVI